MVCRAIKGIMGSASALGTQGQILWGQEVTCELRSERWLGINKLKSQREHHVERPQSRREHHIWGSKRKLEHSAGGLARTGEGDKGQGLAGHSVGDRNEFLIQEGHNHISWLLCGKLKRKRKNTRRPWGGHCISASCNKNILIFSCLNL